VSKFGLHNIYILGRGKFEALCALVLGGVLVAGGLGMATETVQSIREAFNEGATATSADAPPQSAEQQWEGQRVALGAAALSLLAKVVSQENKLTTDLTYTLLPTYSAIEYLFNSSHFLFAACIAFPKLKILTPLYSFDVFF